MSSNNSNPKTPISVYKRLIQEMIDGITDERFITQIYSIIFREYKKEGQNEL